MAFSTVATLEKAEVSRDSLPLPAAPHDRIHGLLAGPATAGCQDGTARQAVVQLPPRRLVPPAAAAFPFPSQEPAPMAKPHRTLKKANHGSRPANSKARKMKRKHIRT